MTRSRLETYLDVLEILAQKGPMDLTYIMCNAHLSCNVIEEYLDFLIKQSLVEERTIFEAGVVFSITQRGTTILKYFRELKQVSSLVEEARNRVTTPTQQRYVFSRLLLFYPASGNFIFYIHLS